MNCTSYNILVKVKNRIDNTHTFSNGLSIEINTAYNEGKMINQEAEVIAVGNMITDIKKGDVVYVHHLVPTDQNKIQDDIYKCTNDNAFAFKSNGKVSARGGFVICKPNKNEHIEETSIGILLKQEKEYSNLCEIAFNSEIGKLFGLEDQDIIYVNNPIGSQSFFYSFKIDGVEYFRVPTSQILYKQNKTKQNAN